MMANTYLQLGTEVQAELASEKVSEVAESNDTLLVCRGVALIRLTYCSALPNMVAIRHASLCRP